MANELPRTVDAIEQGIEANLHPGGQLYAWQGGRVVADAAIGESRPGTAMTADHLLPWMSGTKPIVAAAVMQCIERGLLTLDDRVVQHVPEFTGHGKDAITVWHLLTHTAGLRNAPADRPGQSWDEIIQAIAATPPEPDWAPGGKAGYHVGSSWFVLAEIVRRVDGRMIDHYVREEVFSPLGMNDSTLALGDVDERGAQVAMVYQTDGRQMRPDAQSIAADELARVRPGASGRGPARELGRFYEMLLRGGELAGTRLLDEQTVRDMTTRQRQGMMDQTFRQVMDWGLGIIINSSHLTPIDRLPYNFGPGASASAFGHGGAQSSISFADPAHNLVVVILLNGMPGEPRHHARMRLILDALWQDLAAP